MSHYCFFSLYSYLDIGTTGDSLGFVTLMHVCYPMTGTLGHLMILVLFGPLVIAGQLPVIALAHLQLAPDMALQYGHKKSLSDGTLLHIQRSVMPCAPPIDKLNE